MLHLLVKWFDVLASMWHLSNIRTVLVTYHCHHVHIWWHRVQLSICRCFWLKFFWCL